MNPIYLAVTFLWGAMLGAHFQFKWKPLPIPLTPPFIISLLLIIMALAIGAYVK